MLFAMRAASGALTSLMSPTVLQQQQATDTSSLNPGNHIGSSTPLSFEALALNSAANSATPATAPATCSAETMSALISAQESQSATAPPTLSPKQQQLFSKFDTDGSGSISQAEFEKAFGPDNKALADAIFSKMDKNGDGSISESEFASATQHHHHMHAGPPSSKGGADALMSGTQGATTQSVSNSDGSTTTTITYADGSKVSLTSAVASSTNTSSSTSTQQTANRNFLEQLIRTQSQFLSSSPSLSTTI